MFAFTLERGRASLILAMLKQEREGDKTSPNSICKIVFKKPLQQKATTVARESEIHFRLWPEILVLDQMGKSLSLPERLRDTTFPLSPRTSPQALQPPEPAAQIDFETNPIPDLHLNEGLERGYTL